MDKSTITMYPPFLIIYKSNWQYSEEYGTWLKPMCGFFQVWSQAVTKVLPGRPLGEEAYIRFGVQPMHCSLWEDLQARTQAPLANHALWHTCIPIPRTFISKLLSKPWADLFFRCLGWGLLMGSRGEPSKAPLPRLTQYFSTPHPSPLPSALTPGAIKLLVSFVTGLPQQWDDPHITDPADLDQCVLPWGKAEQKESALSAV